MRKYALLLGALCSGAHGGLVLESFNSPPCTETDCTTAKNMFRGTSGKEGDIWGPPVRGSNRLSCGTEDIGSGSYKGTPLSIDAGSRFSLRYAISRPEEAETGVLRVQMKYGSDVSFVWNDGWDIMNDKDLVDIELGTKDPRFSPCDPGNARGDDSVCAVGTWSLPPKGMGGYTGPATLQIEFKPTELNVERDEDDQIIYYQCIDLDVTNGDTLPAATPWTDQWGYGDPTKDTTTNVRSRSLNLEEEDTGLSTFVIVVIILVVLLVFCLCCLFVKYRRDQNEKQAEKDLEPQPPLQEDIAEMPESVSKEKEPTPPPEPNTDTDPEPPKEPEKDLETGEPGAQAAVGDGSSGRYFHFTYKDAEEK